jgi:hypothetical protein
MEIKLPEGATVGSIVEILWGADAEGNIHSDQYYECTILSMRENAIDIGCDAMGAPIERSTINLETALDDSNRAIEDIRTPRNS